MGEPSVPVHQANRTSTPREWTVNSQQPWTYKLTWTTDLFADADRFSQALSEGRRGGGRPIFVVDQLVYDMYAEQLTMFVEEVDPRSRLVTMSAGEHNKTLSAVLGLVEKLDSIGVQRREDVLVAVGGGVVSDVVTFTASTYRRGVSSFRIPTTLLGLVDAGVGVKTGVNHRDHKNRIGTYFPSEMTFLGPAFLHTLPTRHIRNGVGEILKVAVGCDLQLFSLAEQGCLDYECQSFVDHPDRDEVCRRAVSAMLSELEDNLWEKELRRAVDLGHSFSGKIELSRRDIMHGEAVAWETLLAAQFSSNRGWLDEGDLFRMFDLYATAGLMLDVAPFYAEWKCALDDVELHRDGWQHIPVPSAIGEVRFVEDSTVSEWVAAAEGLTLACAERS